MKTLQETLRSTDPNKLVDAFLDQHPVDLMKDFADNQELTLRQARRRVRIKLERYINRLCNLKVNQHDDSEQFIFLESYVITGENNFYEPKMQLVKLDDVLHCHAKQLNSYDCTMTHQADLLGYWVADTPLTKEYQLDMLAEIMWEASWNGFNEETLDQSIKELEDSIKEIENEDSNNFVAFDEFFEELGIDPHPAWELTKKLNEKYYRAVKKCYQFGIDSRAHEVKLVRKQLIDEGYQVKLTKKKDYDHG